MTDKSTSILLDANDLIFSRQAVVGCLAQRTTPKAFRLQLTTLGISANRNPFVLYTNAPRTSILHRTLWCNLRHSRKKAHYNFVNIFAYKPYCNLLTDVSKTL